jgi:hypothetical protein
MSLESTEDAEKYLKKIHKTLFYLCEIAREAGVNSHAAIFMFISGAFAAGPDHIEEVSKLLMEYSEKKLHEQFLTD